MNASAAPPPPPSTGEDTGAAGRGAPAVPPGEDPRGVPRRAHTMGNWRSLVLSMLVILGGILVWQALVPRPAPITQPAVDAEAVARQAQREARVAVSLPHLGPEWRATSARWGRSAEGLPTWHAGYHRTDDATTYVAVQETAASGEPRAMESWLADAVSDGREDGTADVAGGQWTRYTTSGEPARRALVRRGSGTGLTTVVGGLATYDQLTQFAATLRPYGS